MGDISKFLTDKKISVVIACYNEEPNILPMYERLTKVFQEITPQHEFIYVDNNSTDDSAKIYQELTGKDSSISVIFMSRNFGFSDISFSAGSEISTGDAVVWIDGDLQDPPELIKDFVQKWLKGYEVVYGIRQKRRAGWLLRIGSKFFYRLFNQFSYIDIPLDAGDFSLMDKKVIQVLNSLPERDRFVRGLRSWVGFKQIGIPYIRDERKAGTTTQGLIRYFYTARKGIFSFSYTPLSFITYLAVIGLVVMLVAAIVYPIWAFFSPAPSGFLTLLMVILFIGSIQFVALAILGEYLGRIFEEVKARPKYVIREILNDPRKKVVQEKIDKEIQ
jgi:dolichol-phosphate mannosyltransferase